MPRGKPSDIPTWCPIEMGTGDKVCVDKSEQLVLFNYWKQQVGTGHVIIDLSLVVFDKDMIVVDYVDYTRLASAGILHSGDTTWAPPGSKGAA